MTSFKLFQRMSILLGNHQSLLQLLFFGDFFLLLKISTIYPAVLFLLLFQWLSSDAALFPFVNNIAGPLSQMEKYCILKLPPMGNLMVLIFIYKQLIRIWRCFSCLSYAVMVKNYFFNVINEVVLDLFLLQVVLCLFHSQILVSLCNFTSICLPSFSAVY